MSDTQPAIPSDASELSRTAGALAERAAEIHAAFIRGLRNRRIALAEPTPASASNSAPPVPPEPTPDPSSLTRMAEGLAKEAAESATRHSGGGEAEPAGPARFGSGGLPEHAAALSASAKDLAAHAAANHARHMAMSREASRSFTTAGDPGDDSASARSGKHKKDKKKHRKSRKRCGKSKGD